MSGVPARVEDRDSAPVFALIERMATDPAADVEKLERLMAMHERLLASRAREDYAVALVSMKPDLPKIKRTGYNQSTGSFYAKLEDIIEIVDPILHKHGFALQTKVTEQTDARITVRAELWHVGGHVEHTDVVMPIDDKGINGRVNKTALHATASAITYGKRYAVCAILNIATGVDSDGGLPPRGYSSHAEPPVQEPRDPAQFHGDARNASAKAADEQLLAKARQAASHGREALRSFYAALQTKEERAVVRGITAELQETADLADRIDEEMASREAAELDPIGELTA